MDRNFNENNKNRQIDSYGKPHSTEFCNFEKVQNEHFENE